MTDSGSSFKCVSTPSTPATESKSLGLWTYAQRVVIIGGLLSLLCTANYFLGAVAYNDLDACVDCYVAYTQRRNITEPSGIDVGLTLSGMSLEIPFLPPFTLFVFQGKNRTRTLVIFVCGLLNVLQRLVFYMKQSGVISPLRIGQRCFLWTCLSCLHVLTFSTVCSALNYSSAVFHLLFTDTASPFRLMLLASSSSQHLQQDGRVGG